MESFWNATDSLSWQVRVCMAAGMWTCIFFLSAVVSPRVVGKRWHSLSTVQQKEWHSRVVAFAHASGAIAWGIYMALFDPSLSLEDPVFGYSDRSATGLAFSFGYFLYDAFIVYFVLPRDYFFLFHHAICNIGFVSVFLSRQNFLSIGISLLIELAGPSTQIAWGLDVLHLHNTKMYAFFFLSCLPLTWIGRIGAHVLALNVLWSSIGKGGSDRAIYALVFAHFLMLFLTIRWGSMAVFLTMEWFRGKRAVPRIAQLTAEQASGKKEE